MRINSTLYFVLKDQLGSASVVTDSTGATVGEDRFYPFGETRFTTGNMQTDKLFTGQREITGLGIYDYGARFYSPKLGRFLSADTIVPRPFNPQDLNRYSYTENNPLKYTDPSGRCSVSGHWMDDSSPACTWAASQTLKTYTAAGITTQNPPIDRPSGRLWRKIRGEYSGVGPAKVTDKQMETPYGEVVKDNSGQRRGVGLGLREPGSCTPTNCSPDQLDPEVANQAMELRISLRTNVCKNHGCSETDIFVVAALAENESIYPDQIKMALNKYPATSGSTVIDWNKYLEEADPNNYVYNHGLITSFTANVLELQEKGWYVPSDIDWDYIYNIINPPYPSPYP